MIKRLKLILNSQLDRIEKNSENNNNISTLIYKENLEFKNNLNDKIKSSSNRIDNLRQSIRNTKL